MRRHVVGACDWNDRRCSQWIAAARSCGRGRTNFCDDWRERSKFCDWRIFTSCFCRQTWLVSSGWLGARVQHCVARHRAFAAIFRGGCASCARGHDRANEHGIRAHRAGQGFIAAARGRTSRIEKRISTSAELAGARYRRGVDRFICGGKSVRGARSWSSLCRRGLGQGHHVGHGHNAGVWASGGAVEFSGGHVVRMD